MLDFKENIELLNLAEKDQSCYEQQRCSDLYIQASEFQQKGYDNYRTLCLDALKKNKQQEKEMHDYTNIEVNQRRYMAERLWMLKSENDGKITEQFHMNPPRWPTSAKEMVEKITSGKFSFKPQKRDDESVYYGSTADVIFADIDWEDPNGPKKDQEGYNKAYDKLCVDFSNLNDTIQLAPVTDAVKAFEDFKNWTYVH